MKTKLSLPLAGLLCMPGFAAFSATPSTALTAIPQIFYFSPDFPKYVTCDVEFRDPTEVKWPQFFYGKPVAPGSINLARMQAAFAMRCDKMPQKNGDQSRKVLGELCQPDKTPVVSLGITGIQPVAAGAPSPGSKAKNAMRVLLTGLMDIDGRRIPFKALTSLKYHQGKGDEKNASLMADGRFEFKASELGLKAFKAEDVIRIRFGFTAFLKR